jgi:hypothetical protein
MHLLTLVNVSMDSKIRLISVSIVLEKKLTETIGIEGNFLYFLSIFQLFFVYFVHVFQSIQLVFQFYQFRTVLSPVFKQVRVILPCLEHSILLHFILLLSPRHMEVKILQQKLCVVIWVVQPA